MSQQVELACRAADSGAFDTAVAVCRTVPPQRLEFAACSSLLASVYRQVGRHDLAEPFDLQGLAAQIPDALGLVMCRLGLAADRIGPADLDGARSAMHRAEVALEGLRPWHWATRWFDPWITHAWISAEILLSADEPAAAVDVLAPFARVGPRETPNTRWPFERAKTLLFLGVAQRCAGEMDSARSSIAAAARICAEARLAPLLVPVHEQLAWLDPREAVRWEREAAAARLHLRRHRPPGA